MLRKFQIMEMGVSENRGYLEYLKGSFKGSYKGSAGVGSFRKLRLPYFGALIILLFRVLY